tara:strand:- start:74 stop:805 length:732 start_codon:yes stop_codon:yes gene_type:complete
MRYLLTAFITVVALFAPVKSGVADMRFSYDIIMWNSTIAEASIIEKDNKRYRGKQVTKLFGTLKTKERWKKVKNLNNGMISVIAKSGYAVQTTTNINNNGKSKDYTFDYKAYYARGFKTQDNKSRRILVKSRHKSFHDGLSWLQHVRGLDLRPDYKFNFEVFNLGRFYDVSGVVESTEQVWTPLGEKESHRIRFKITTRRRGKLKSVASTVWISADPQRIPVQMMMTTKLGLAKILINKIEKY